MRSPRRRAALPRRPPSSGATAVAAVVLCAEPDERAWRSLPAAEPQACRRYGRCDGCDKWGWCDERPARATMPAVTSETPWRLLALAPLDLELWQALFGDLPLDVVMPAERSQPAVAAAIGDAEIVVGDWTGALRVTGAEVAAARRLAFVQQPSVGVDTLDIDALAAAGVPAANAAGANAVSVAEWCVGASYAVLRWLAWADAQVRDGEWPQLEVSRRGGGELAGRRVGIIGMGRIGVECAQRFVALGADVAHWGRRGRAAGGGGGGGGAPPRGLPPPS